MAEYREELERLLLASVRDLFVTRKGACEIRRSDLPHPSDTLVVVTIGFTGELAWGTVTLLSPRRVVDRLRPAEVNETDDNAMCDVLGELANLMGGRLKRLLTAHAIEVSIGVPTKGIARGMRFTDRDFFESYQEVRLDRDRVFVRLDVSFDASFSGFHSSESSPPCSTTNEGELLFLDDI